MSERAIQQIHKEKSFGIKGEGRNGKAEERNMNYKVSK